MHWKSIYKKKNVELDFKNAELDLKNVELDLILALQLTLLITVKKGVFAKNERGYRVNAIKKRF